MKSHNCMSLAVFLLLLTGFIGPAIADDDPNSLGPPVDVATLSSKKKPVMLVGGVEHSAVLPPVPMHLRAGATIDVAKLKALTPNNEWFRIPKWFAGTWLTRDHNTYYEQSLLTGMESFPVESHYALGEGTSGFQKDRKGDIWEYVYGQYLSLKILREGFTIDLVHTREPVEVTDDKVVIMFRSHQCRVSAATRRIVRTEQTESIQTYTSVGNGLMRVDCSIKSFDEDGRPVCLTKVLAYSRRVEPFRSWDKYDGRDMRKLFDEYLTTHGLSDLLVAGAAK